LPTYETGHLKKFIDYRTYFHRSQDIVNEKQIRAIIAQSL